MRWSLGALVLSFVAACGGADAQEGEAASPPPAGAAPDAPRAPDAPSDEDPDKGADPEAPSPPEAPDAPSPATRAELIARFAPHFHFHPEDTRRPANVDWYLARVTMGFDHPDCDAHDFLGLGKVTQASLVAATHAVACNDQGTAAKATADARFYLKVASASTYAGAPRTDWKAYVVWRSRADGKADVEYWVFYPYNDAFAIFDHEADWEHVRVTIDPKASEGQGKVTELRFSQHAGGEVLAPTDPKVSFDGTHVVAYAAKGTHANYPKPGSFSVPGAIGIAIKDEAKAAPANAVWKSETALVEVGTRAAPKNGQVFVKFWGLWGKPSDLPASNGITRHFP